PATRGHCWWWWRSWRPPPGWPAFTRRSGPPVPRRPERSPPTETARLEVNSRWTHCSRTSAMPSALFAGARRSLRWCCSPGAWSPPGSPRAAPGGSTRCSRCGRSEAPSAGLDPLALAVLGAGGRHPAGDLPVELLGIGEAQVVDEEPSQPFHPPEAGAPEAARQYQVHVEPSRSEAVDAGEPDLGQKGAPRSGRGDVARAGGGDQGHESPEQRALRGGGPGEEARHAVRTAGVALPGVEQLHSAAGAGHHLCKTLHAFSLPVQARVG